MNKAVILLSGGLDSATVLCLAKLWGYRVHCLSFDYGQRHAVELEAARALAAANSVDAHHTITLDLSYAKGSSLINRDLAVPANEQVLGTMPNTYVPGRNTIFLAYALSYAESIGAFDIFIGANILDYSGYPDCRPIYIDRFNDLIAVAIESSESRTMTIHAPLLYLNKAEIIQLGLKNGLDYSKTISCYNPDAKGLACSECPSCIIRRKGFAASGTQDPTLYR